jgi:hypothetical protein
MDASVVRRLLEQHGVNTFALEEVELLGAPLSMIVKEAIGRADLVIAVLGRREESGQAFFELGVAQGLQKPTLIIATEEETIPMLAATGIPYLRAKPDSFSSLEFGLAQFLAAPRRGHANSKVSQKETRPLGQEADELLAKLHANQARPGSRHGNVLLRELIVQALRASRVSAVAVDQKQGDARIDIAVWSDDLEPWVRNPLLIQVKESLPGRGELDTLVKRIANVYGPGLVNWVLVIYGDAAHRVEELALDQNDGVERFEALGMEVSSRAFPLSAVVFALSARWRYCLICLLE